MSKTAFVFPGQGSQSAGMGKDLFDNFTSARRVFEQADDALGFSLSQICFTGSDADLQMTANTQPAILTVSVAAFQAALDEGIKAPDFVAGHSLGEYSALVAAGVIDFVDAVRVVRKRGQFMQEAVPAGVGAMAAIIGADVETVDLACAEAAEDQICSPANINSPTQVVIAGNSEAVGRACDILKARGAKRAIRLNVSAPFHCQLMMPAQTRLAGELSALDIRTFSCPAVHNVDAAVNIDESRVVDALTRQVSMPVRWLESVRALRSAGAERAIEIGPGKVLSGLIRQIDRDLQTLNIEDSASLRSTIETLSN